jgi:DNA-directed RNA polymerase subunit E'/Rpb7
MSSLSLQRLQRFGLRLGSLFRLPDYWKEALSYSQAGQDVWVYGEVFNQSRCGFFVDLGAFDGVFLSNTYLLEKDMGGREFASKRIFKLMKSLFGNEAKFA